MPGRLTALIKPQRTDIVELRQARADTRTFLVTDAHVLTADTTEVAIRNDVRSAIDLRTHGGPRPAFTLDVGHSR